MAFRKIFFTLLLFFSFARVVFSDDYESFREFYKVNNFKEGLPFIKAAYNSDPQNAKYRYFYATSLYRLNHFKEAIVIFEKEAPVYNKLSHHYFLARTHQAIENFERARLEFEKVILMKDDAFGLKGRALSHLITVYLSLDRLSKAIELIPQINAYDQSKPEVFKRKENLCNFSDAVEQQYYKYLYKGNINKAEILYYQYWNRFGALCNIYPEEFGPEDGKIYADSLRYWNANQAKLKKAYVNKFLVLLIANVDATYIDDANKTVVVKGKFINEQLNRYIQEFELLNKMYFYYTNGKMKIKTEFKFVNSTLTKIERITYQSGIPATIKIQIDSIKPYPVKLMHYAINQYDAFFFVFPTRTRGTSVSGLALPVIIPKKSRSKVKRAIITLGSERVRTPTTIIHELFHAIEQSFKFRPPHLYRKKYKHKWPSWYHGEGQLFYYKKFFENFVEFSNIRKIFWRLKKDNTAILQPTF